MKFREYVGVKIEKKVKESIIPLSLIDVNPTTENGFLEQVVKEPFVEKKEWWLEYSLNKKHLKRTFDYIRSWLMRYKVPFKPTNPHITVYLLENILSQRELLLDSLRKLNNIYKPMGTITIISPNEKDFPRTIMESTNKDELVLNYVPHDDHEKVFDILDIIVVKKFCHIKMFEMQCGILNHRMYEDMMYSMPPLPTLKANKIRMRD